MITTLQNFMQHSSVENNGLLEDKLIDMERKVSKIRRRISYEFWKKIYECVGKKNKMDKLLAIFELLDNWRMLGSNKNAYYSYESLYQLLKDEGFENEVLAREISERIGQP